MASCVSPLPVRVQWAAGEAIGEGGSSAGWAWQTVTSLPSGGPQSEAFLLDQEITITRGQSDWESGLSPADLSFRIYDPVGWLPGFCHPGTEPQLVRGMPVRVQVDPDGTDTWATRFCGELTGWELEWDDGTHDSACLTDGHITTVTAVGVFSRLAREAPWDWALPRWFRREVLDPAVDAVHVWPLRAMVPFDNGTELEQTAPAISDGAGTTVFHAFGIGGRLALVEPQRPLYGADRVWEAEALPDSIAPRATIDSPTPATWSCGALVYVDQTNVTASAGGALVDLFGVVQVGVPASWDRAAFFLQSGAIKAVLYDRTAAPVATILQESTLFSGSVAGWWAFQIDWDGADYTFTADVVSVGSVVSGSTALTPATADLGLQKQIGCFNLWNGAAVLPAPTQWSHFWWRDSDTSTLGDGAIVAAGTAHVGEQPYERADRFEDEQATAIDACTDAIVDQPLGPQRPGLNLIEQLLDAGTGGGSTLIAEALDCTSGVVFRSAGCLCGQTPIVIDIADPDSGVTSPLLIVNDAFGNGNQITLSDSAGWFPDEVFPASSPSPLLGVAASVSVETDAQMPGQAEWRYLGLDAAAPGGAGQTFRLPVLSVDLLRAGAAERAALEGLEIGDAVEVTGWPSTFCLPASFESLFLVVGWTESVSAGVWRLELNLAPGLRFSDCVGVTTLLG